MLRIRLDLENLTTITSRATSQTADVQSDLRNEIIQSLVMHQDGVKTSLHQVYDQVDQRIAKVEEMVRSQAEQAQINQSTQFGPLYRARPANRRRSSPQAIATLNSSSPPALSEGVRVRLNQYAVNCRSGCICTCHKPKRTATPALVDRLLGQMFVGYAGLPLLSTKCDSKECEKAQVPNVNLEYWFPLGLFWSQIIRLQVGYQPNVGPQFSLSTLRRVSDSAQCVNFALNGDIDGLKDLFIRGLASPRDVSSTRGYSLLRVSQMLHEIGSVYTKDTQWALYGKKYNTCKFLVHAGADPEYR